MSQMKLERYEENLRFTPVDTGHQYLPIQSSPESYDDQDPSAKRSTSDGMSRTISPDTAGFHEILLLRTGSHLVAEPVFLSSLIILHLWGSNQTPP
ncbi:hypothetical protein JTE90_020353 [Oedothorax gibbosus]|uniref:Uncharacterized protein n=1 Tax=Oedothorax gibbosus TaxID=931172 RepID=A0AAV6TU37_9ARAC|nr:hypothetical protein JTE90_020353 [Oedothorax gibbosus]